VPIGDVCVRDVIIASRATTVLEAAHLMRQHHVGNLVVVDDVNGKRLPVGIVTDRDIVVSVIALGLDARVFSVGDLLLQDLVSVREDQGIFECIQQMRLNGVRRMPIVDREGALVGIMSVDDLVQLLSEEMDQLAKLMTKERALEAQVKR
jgi:CBS domain-containing protein